MKKLISTLILSTLLIASYGTSQTNNNTATTANSVNEVVLNQLKVIYGEYYQSSILDNPSQIQFYTDFYKRCEYISVNDAPTAIPNISTLHIKDKYNPGEIRHDYTETFDASEFMVLKYQFDFYNTTDTYFLIYGTDTVLKINKIN